MTARSTIAGTMCCSRLVSALAAPCRTLWVTVCMLSPGASARCSVDVPMASVCARFSLNSRKPAKPRARQKRTIDGGLTLALRASASTLARSANCGSSSTVAATCCCAFDNVAARSRIVKSRSHTGAGVMLRRLDTRINFAAGSEKRPNRARHTIVVVDGEHGAPLVEGRARMRNAASDKIADLRRIAGGEAQIRVLVVHPGNFPRPRHRLRRGVDSGAVALCRHRQVEVDRGVALSHGENGEPRLGAGLHARPHLERRLQPCTRLPRGAAARLDLLEHAIVEARIVRDVAAAAQNRQHRSRQTQRQFTRDDLVCRLLLEKKKKSRRALSDRTKHELLSKSVM